MCVCVCVVGWFTEGVEVVKCQRDLVKGKFWEVGNPREHLTSMKDRLLKKYMYKFTLCFHLTPSLGFSPHINVGK